ncbi:MAG TPA: response regulator [Steroidobacteraceae bacterium]
MADTGQAKGRSEAAMNIDAMAMRMSVLTRALPMRILLVSSDDPESSSLEERMAAGGFEVERARGGNSALEQLERQWFPLIVTASELPDMDGLAFTELLRARGLADIYVMMLSLPQASIDYARCARVGVDDYLSVQIPDDELFARLRAALNTIALRRSLEETRAALATASPIDSETGAFTARETLSRLDTELHRALRYGRSLSVLLIGVRCVDRSERPPSAALKTVVDALRQTIRAHVDWIGRVEGRSDEVLFAIVLVEAAPGDGPNIKERLRTVLGRIPSALPLEFDFGLVGLDRTGAEGATIDAAALIQVADHCRVCSGRAGSAQLSAIQRSVAVGATIACRHGYAVESYCMLKVHAVTQRTGQPERAADPS